MTQSRSLNELSPRELDQLIETVVELVSERLGLPPDGAPGGVPGGAAAAAPMKPLATPMSPAAAPTAGKSCSAGTAEGSCATAAVVKGGKESDRLAVPAGVAPSECRSVAPLIDHTILKPNASEEEILKVCAEARQYGFASVCVNGGYVDLVSNALRGSDVKTCAVVGFPLGAMTPDSKAFEARDVIRRGADEVDMVANIGLVKSGHFADVLRDMLAVREATRGHVLKVIIETSLLTDDEKRAACVLAKAAEADFVKTSTGFSGGGATADDVALMRAVVGPKMGVKASGGVRTCEDAAAMVASGATRLGASASVAIITGETKSGAKGY